MSSKSCLTSCELVLEQGFMNLLSRLSNQRLLQCIFLTLTIGLVPELLADDPITPEVAPASSEGKESMMAIRLPADWEIDLFSAEPDIANVVAFDFDHQGRIYVCETFRQNQGVTDNRGHDDRWLLADLAAETVQDRIDYHRELLAGEAITYEQHDDRVRRIEDTDGDGIADTSLVVASGFNQLEEGTGASILWRPSGLYYTCIPKLWKLIDRDEDGVVDDRVVMADGFGVRVAFRGHDLHGLLVGPDGRLYFSIGDRGYHVTTEKGEVLADPTSGAVFRCELDGSGLEVYSVGLRNPQELAFNDVGDFFTVDNNSDSGDQARVVHLLQDADSGWRMHYQYLPDRGPFNRESIWKPFHPEQPAYIVPPIANFTDGPSGLTYYPGTGFGDQFKHHFFICDFRGGAANSGVQTFTVEPDGASYRFVSSDKPIWNVLATDVGFGPDGSLYVSDWVNGWDGLGKGRIYRISDPRHSQSEIVSEVKKKLSENWQALDEMTLRDCLEHADRRIRLEAQWELARRESWPVLAAVACDTTLGPLSRLHAIWGVDQIARMNQSLEEPIKERLRGLLFDQEAVIRSAAVKFAGDRQDDKAIERIQELLEDQSARVQYYALRALGEFGDRSSEAAVLRVISEQAESDTAIRHAGILALSQTRSAEELKLLSQHEVEIVRRSAVVALRRLHHAGVAVFLNDESPLVAAEAASAIYDLPIQEAMQHLGETLGKTTRSMEYYRRALNANHRVGTLESAMRIAEYAASNIAPDVMKLEALQLLENWNQTDPRDRVLNAYRPLPVREFGDAVIALEMNLQVLMGREGKVRDEAIRVASQLGISGIAPMLVNRVGNESLNANERASALDALSRLDPNEAVQLAGSVRMLPADDLLLSALRVLAEHSPEASKQRLFQAIASRDMRTRQLGWDLLATVEGDDVMQVIHEGLESYLAGSLPKDVSLNLLEAAQGRISKEWEVKLGKYGEKRKKEDALGQWLPSLEGGDVNNGRRLFFEDSRLSCLRCHQIGRAGGKVGPNLTTIGASKTRRYLLESICLPNAEVAKGFETAVILTVDGNTVSGIVKAENDDSIDLIKADASIVRLKLDDIEARRTGKSSMPEDLVTKLTPRQLRDLVAYLFSLKTDPRAADEVE